MKSDGLKQKGFTLLEVIIYLALFSLIMGGAFAAAYALVESSQRTSAALEVQADADFINRKLNWVLTNAQNVESFSPESVRIEPGSIIFAQTGDAFTIARAGAAPVALSQSMHVVTDTNFSVTPAAGGKPTSITLSYTINGTPFTFASYLRH